MRVPKIGKFIAKIKRCSFLLTLYKCIRQLWEE